MAINNLARENIVGALTNKSSNPQEIETKTSNYTLAFPDKDRFVTVTASTDTTVTIPNNTTTQFLVGSKIDIANIGTGTLTIAGASGVTLNGVPTILAQNQSAQITKLGDNSWIVRGYASFDSPDFTGTVDLPATTNYDGEQLSTTFASKADISVATNAQTDNYTFVLSDAGKFITVNASVAKTVTIPTNSSVAFPVGTVIAVATLGTGAVTIAGASGVTVNSTAGVTPALATQYSGAQCYKTATDTWLVIGAIE
jgi:hypothetical protein